MAQATERPSDVNAPPVPRHPIGPGGVGRCGTAAGRGTADTSDRRLLADMATGNRSALARLHSEYFSRLASFFAHVMPLSAPNVVDDLIADTLFDVWSRCATLANDCSVHVAIVGVAWSHVSRRLPGGDGSRTTLLQPAAQIFEALTPLGRAIIHLVYAGHSRQEVADVLSISCEAVDACLTSWRAAPSGRLVSSDSFAAAASDGPQH